MDTNLKQPLVSVVMIVYNAEKYVQESIESICTQTYTNWELIIVYDPSTDNTLSIIQKIAERDSRIRILQNNPPLGLLGSRNQGLKESRGEYIAILDSDDIAFPQRLQVQVNFLESYPNIAVVGSGLQVLNDTRGERIVRNETDPEVVSAGLLFNTMIAHSTAMIRKSFLDAHKISYNPEFSFAEDYAMWVQCARHGRITNISDILITYREHSGSHTSKSRTEQSQDVSKLRKTILEHVGIHPTDEELKLHNSTSVDNEDREVFIRKQITWFQKIRDTNKKTCIYESRALSHILEKRLYTLCAQNLNLKTFLLFLIHPFGSMQNHTYKVLKLGFWLLFKKR